MSTSCTPRAYLYMPNVQKQKNFGTLLRSAAAFDFHEVFMLERDRKGGGEEKEEVRVSASLGIHGSQGTREKMPFRYFSKEKDIRPYCTSQGITICGIELMEGKSRPVQEHPFTGSTLFLLGNEASGLSQSLLSICDTFVHIDHYTDKTPSLNVSVAGSIVFHHFGVWARYCPRPLKGFKVEQNDAEVAAHSLLVSSVGLAVQKDPQVVRLARAQRREKEREETEDPSMDF